MDKLMKSMLEDRAVRTSEAATSKAALAAGDDYAYWG